MNNEKTNQLLDQLIKLAHREHYFCEDGYYTCPKSEHHYTSDGKGECNCGADKHNKKVTDLSISLKNLLGV